MHDSKKYLQKKTFYRQDLHAQILTINDLSESDFGVYVCVICSKYGRSSSKILLEPGNIQGNVQLYIRFTADLSSTEGRLRRLTAIDFRLLC